jgi:hypothetical protein
MLSFLALFLSVLSPQGKGAQDARPLIKGKEKLKKGPTIVDLCRQNFEQEAFLAFSPGVIWRVTVTVTAMMAGGRQSFIPLYLL